MIAYDTRERAVGETGHGDHLCLAFTDDAEQRRVAVAYLLDGLRRGERVMYFADRSTPEQVLDWLRGAGADPAPALAKGQLTVTTAGGSYLAGGPFDPDAMVATLHQEVAGSLRAGYTGFRVSGEMGWVLRDTPGAERLGEYETKVNEVFTGRPASAICQYDARRFDPAVLHDFDRRHSGSVEQEPLHTGSMLRLVPSFRDGQRSLRVVGDVDHHSAQALAAALETTLDWPGDIIVDMSGLQFIDLAGVRALVRAAERLPAGRCLHVVDLAPMLSHVMHVVGWDQVPSLTVTAREVPA
ncbi:anti-anti-sigma factor [Streptomyces sp. V3I8]|uniref:MEDS domain-containing protein n=1 Tax=Streptomyces sp. V3I8 TaxID=3042279 RepID=UPI002786DC6F|nr:MEDS domain-containing protein [Streptomyces sp. V3I8]MDQ1033688.1 anti-anti-sigma factor [Streptomyces sp. V3I8]